MKTRTEGKTRRLQRLAREERVSAQVVDNLRDQVMALHMKLNTLTDKLEVENDLRRRLVNEWLRCESAGATARWAVPSSGNSLSGKRIR